MHFELNESQQKLVQMVRDFCLREVKPHATEWDREERFPREVVAHLGELGLLGMTVPEELGGSALDTLSVAAVVEEIARWDGSLALTVASHNGLGTSHLLRFGNEELRRRYIPDIAAGRKLAAWGLTEPGSGSDAAGMRTTAVRKDKGWVLNGTKMFISHADVAEWGVVFARSDRAKGRGGISAFIVEKGTPGFTARPIRTIRTAAVPCEVSLEDCRVPAENLVGEEGRGLDLALGGLVRQRFPYAATNLGVAVAAHRMAIEHAKHRETFGARLKDRQAIQWMLVDAEVELRAARWLIWEGAWKADRGEDARVEASIAKLYSSEVLGRVIDSAVQIHGGYGVSKEFPLERWYREARVRRIGEGPSEVQRMVIARSLFR